ncbi:hypothetical protein [Mycobacterium sp. 1245805.9]|uniref:hypothetical protein n=1 Tax=Mycobacterium sp. 1245805.9 TaxID=1856862 RepID=UPI0012EA0E12|nr:hypothetical protein [Mycobacterium sp. 1245805.9]
MTAIQLDGAARGIGLATAKAFAAKGSRVFLGDLAPQRMCIHLGRDLPNPPINRVR